MRKLAEMAERGMALKIQTAVRETAREVIFNTPVDTGEAASSWELGIGWPQDGRREPYRPLPELHSKVLTFEQRRFYERVNKERALAAVENRLKWHRFGQRLYLTNAVEGDGGHYLQTLNTVPEYSLQATRLAGLFWIERAGLSGRVAARLARVF